MVKNPEELIDIIVESVGLVPIGANKRRFVVTKGGKNMSVAEDVLERPDFWQKVAKGFMDISHENYAEGDDLSVPAVQMALKILEGHMNSLPSGVQEAVSQLRSFAEGDMEDETPEDVAEEPAAEDEEDEEEMADLDVLIPDDDTESEDDNEEDDDEDEEDEMSMKDSDEEDEEEMNQNTQEGFNNLPQDVIERFTAVENRLHQTEAELAAARAEKQRNELRALAEGFSALPDVTPDNMTETLYNLKNLGNDEVFSTITSILKGASESMAAVYGEVGSTRSDNGPASPFEERVEAKAKELYANGSYKDYNKAYAEAYSAVAHDAPGIANAHLQTRRTRGR